MKKKNAVVAVVMGLAMVATTTMPVFAATSGVQGKLDKNLKHAQKWVERQTDKLLRTAKPVTQASAVRQLMATFNDVPSWPKNLEVISPGQTSGFQWLDGKKNPYDKPNEWVGLKCVFPGVPASQYTTLLRITPTKPTGTLTAAQLSQWVVNWEVAARRVDMKIEPTQNPYGLLKLFSFFYGTHITGPNSIVTQKDVSAIRNNIVEVSRGWRLLARNKIQILAPLQDVRTTVGNFPNFARVHHLTGDQVPKYGPMIDAQDSATLTFERNGNVVYRYQKGLGYVPETGGGFTTRKGIVYSAYSWPDYYAALAFKKDEPSLQAKGYDLPSPEVFSPAHKTHPGPIDVSFPKPAQRIFLELSSEIDNQYSITNGQILFQTPMLVVGYTDGIVKWVEWLPPATSYPAEAMLYA